MMNYLFVQVTPSEGWAEGGEFYFWLCLDTKSKSNDGKNTMFPASCPILGFLTPNLIFTSINQVE